MNDAPLDKKSFEALCLQIASLSAKTGFDGFFKHAGQLVVDLLGADFATVLVQRQDGNVHFRSSHGLPAQIASELPSRNFSSRNLVSMSVWRVPDTLFVPDYGRHPRSNEYFTRLGVTSAFYVPSWLSEARIGAVLAIAWYGATPPPSTEKAAAVRAVAGMVASALYRERLETQLNNAVRLHSVLSHVNQAIIRVRCRIALFQEVCEIAVAQGGMRLAWVAEPPDDGIIRPLAVAGDDRGYTDSLRVSAAGDAPEGRGPAGDALRTGKLTFVRDIATDSRMAPWREAALARGFRSSACIPIRVDGTFRAILSVYADQPDFFGEPERALLREIGADLSFAVSHIDDAERLRNTREKLAWESSHDTLTGLPNRGLLVDRLRQALDRANRHDDYAVALLLLDIDELKDVNDRFGHSEGDELLRRMASQLRDCVRDSDTAARLGGDEFVLLLDDIRRTGGVDAALNRVLSVIEQPVRLGAEPIQLSVSIGIAVYPFEDGASSVVSGAADTLLSRADLALREAKSAGGNTFRVFEVGLARAMRARYELRRRVESALDEKRLAIHYQPKVDMCSGEVLGVEALVRFMGENDVPERPAPFLAAIAGTPLMHRLDLWVLEAVAKQITDWLIAGEPLAVSVNVSRECLRRRDCIHCLEHLFSRFPHARGRLAIEVLETVNAEDLLEVSGVFDELAEIGVELILDDFGTGASSLVHLQRVPAQEIKIDQGFVRALPDRPENEAIVKALLAFAEMVPRRVVAEGVETIELGARLRHLGCRYAQGYAIARPMTPAELAVWRRDWQPPAEWCSVETGYPIAET